MRTERGVCKCCGQMRMVRIPESMEDPSQDEIDLLATEECNCEGAHNYRERDKIIRAAQQDIDAMLTSSMPEVSVELAQIVPLVYDEKIKRITLKMPDGITVSLFKAGRGIKITHEKKQKTELLSE